MLIISDNFFTAIKKSFTQMTENSISATSKFDDYL